MIGVVMRHQNVRQRPAFALERLDDRSGFRRIDRRGGLGGRIVNEIAKIVG